MPNLINYQAATQNFYNPYAQYGVNMGTGSGAASGINWLSLASSLGGSGLSAAGLIGSIAMQSYLNRKYYADYQSPEARMQQMRDAGINPYAAAQGIAGGAAPSVAAPQISQESFRSLGEQFGGSVNSALEASLMREQLDEIKSKVRVNDATARGLGVDTDFQLTTFDDRAAALKKQNKLTDYQIEQLRPYAEHADEWYKVNFDKLDKEVNYIQKQMDQIDEQIKNLEKQRDLWDSEIGLNDSTKRYNDSVTALNKQKKELVDKLGGEDVESAYVIARIEGDDKKAEAIKSGIKQYNKSIAEGHYEANPFNEDYRDAKSAIQTIDNAVSECEDVLAHELPEKFFSGEISDEEYKRLDRELSETIRSLKKQRNSVQKAYDKKSYQQGYHTMWQDQTSTIISSASHLVGTIGGALLIKGGMQGGKGNTGSTEGSTKGWISSF